MRGVILVGLFCVACAAPNQPDANGINKENTNRTRTMRFDEQTLDNMAKRGPRQKQAPNAAVRTQKQIQRLINNMQVRFPTIATSAGFVGDQYTLLMVVSGFLEKEIAVEARQGVVVIKAAHKSTDGFFRKTFEDEFPLPPNVDTEAGGWIYNGQVLSITFPMKRDASDLRFENRFTVHVPVRNAKELANVQVAKVN